LMEVDGEGAINGEVLQYLWYQRNHRPELRKGYHAFW